ncbi:MAG: hypothetical protein WCJ51_00510 [Candidatus Moraniibacteriota bacterium]
MKKMEKLWKKADKWQVNQIEFVKKIIKTKKMVFFLIAVMLLIGVVFLQSDTKKQTKRISQYFNSGKNAVTVIPRQIKNEDVASDAGIEYVKLNLENSIETSDLGNGVVTSAKIANNSVVGLKIMNGAINSGKIFDGTILGGDLATDIEVITTGQVIAESLSDGVLTLENGNLKSNKKQLDIEVGGSSNNSEVFISNPGKGEANLKVENNITGGGSLGTAGSRWSTIYVDTVNFLSGLSNADNTGGNSSAINLGTAGTDSADIHIGNAGANISLTDSNWKIQSNGDAEFGTLTVNGGLTNIGNLTSSGNLTSTAGGLNIANSGVFGGAVTANNLIIIAGGFDITGNSDMRGDIDMHNNILTNIGNAGTDFTISGGLDLAGTLKLGSDLNVNNNNIVSVNTISTKDVEATGVYKINGSEGITKTIMVGDGASGTCNITIEGGLIIWTTCDEPPTPGPGMGD